MTIKQKLVAVRDHVQRNQIPYAVFLGGAIVALSTSYVFRNYVDLDVAAKELAKEGVTGLWYENSKDGTILLMILAPEDLIQTL